LIVDYTLNFSQAEVDANFEFEHGVVLFELDAGEPFGGGDGPLYVIDNQVDNPNRTTLPFSRPFTDILGTDLNTELGAEEIWAEVYARNRTTAGQVISRKSPVINTSPS
jgi:hypothetical protein